MLRHRMKKSLVSVLFLCGMFIATSSFAAQGGPSVERGKALFNDTKLGTNGPSCNTCHADGRGLESTFTKKQWIVDGKAFNSLEGAINSCIVTGLRGKPLHVNSDDMQSIVFYIKSVGIERNLLK